MDKSSTIELTLKEVESFRMGQTPAKLLTWDLTIEEFNNMLNNGQIKIVEGNE